MKHEKLIELINQTLGVDIKKETRIREYVYARFIYAKIMRDKGFSLSYIGNTINKDHSTIIHALKQFELLKKYDDFKKMYNKVKIAVYKEERPIYFTHLKKCKYEIRRY